MTDLPTTPGPSTSLWMYRGLWGMLTSYFRVPEQAPTPPARSGEAHDSFKPARAFLKYLKLGYWIAMLIFDVIILGLGIALSIVLWPWGLLALAAGVLVLLFLHIISYLALHLRYDTTWYILTDRALRIRRGIWAIHETTITFENVQNVKVSQGPLQRVFGIANVVVETAGSGGGSQQQQQQSMANMGLIEGVTDAERIRDRIMGQLRQSTSAGLGDEEDRTQPSRASSWTEHHLAVLREIRSELAAITGDMPQASQRSQKNQ